MSGSRSHAWWAMVVLLLVDGAVFASLVFAYFYLWTVTTAGWPPAGNEVAAAGASLCAAAGWAACSIAIAFANSRLRAGNAGALFNAALIAALLLTCGAFALNWQALWSTNMRPDANAYGAVSYALLAWQGLHVVLLIVMGIYTLARSWCGLLDNVRRATFDHTRLMWHYAVVQGLIALLVMHAPRL